MAFASYTTSWDATSCLVQSGPERPSVARVRTQTFDDESRNGVFGHRVPVGTSVGGASRAAVSSFYAITVLLPRTAGQLGTPGWEAKRNSVPSTHIRCRMTPIRRAMAVTARFMPRRRATRRPQAFNQDGLALCIMTVAA